MEFTAMGFFLSLAGVLSDYRGAWEASIAEQVTEGQYETLPLALLRFGRKETISCLVVWFPVNRLEPGVRTKFVERLASPRACPKRSRGVPAGAKPRTQP